MDNESQPLLFGMSPSQMIGMLLTYKWSILFLSTLGLIGAVYLYQVAEPVYLSEAKLLVRYLKEGIALEDGPGGGQVKSVDRSGSKIINTEVEILTSRSLVEELVDDIGSAVLVGGEDNGSSRNRAIANVLHNLSVDVSGGSNIIWLRFSGANPEVVQQVLDRVVQLYLRKHAIVHNTAGEYEFLSQQTDQMRTRLAKTEEELRSLKQEIGVNNLEDSKFALATRVEKLHEGLRDARAKLAAALSRVESAGAVMNGAAPVEQETSEDEVVGAEARDRIIALTQTLQTLRAREMQLLGSFSSESSPVLDLRVEIERKEQSLRAETAAAGGTLEGSSSWNEFINPADQQSEVAARAAEVAALRASIKVLLEYQKSTQKDIQILNEREAELVRLQRQWELLEANYRYYAQSLEHARIEDALNSGRAANISIVQEASLPLGARYSNRNRPAATSLMAGLGLGLLLAFVRGWAKSDRLVLSADVTQAVGARTLIALPRAEAARKIGTGRGKQRPLELPSHEGEMDSGPGQGGLHHQLRPYFDALCDRLLITLNGHGEKPVLLGVTCCEPGVGVSTITAGLGGALSRLGEGRVLLVDAAGTPTGGDQDVDAAGMIDVMNDGHGNVAIIKPNLYMLTAREVTDDVNQVGMFQKLKDLVKTLEESSYRYILLELPPISDTSSALVLARHLRGVVIVLESEKDRKEHVARAAALLRDTGATVLGAVLNKRKKEGCEL